MASGEMEVNLKFNEETIKVMKLLIDKLEEMRVKEEELVRRLDEQEIKIIRLENIAKAISE